MVGFRYSDAKEGVLSTGCEFKFSVSFCPHSLHYFFSSCPLSNSPWSVSLPHTIFRVDHGAKALEVTGELNKNCCIDIKEGLKVKLTHSLLLSYFN